VTTENNVNCAALAELHAGAGIDRDAFVFLQVGVAIGAGVVIGESSSAVSMGPAGEVARLTHPWRQGLRRSVRRWRRDWGRQG